MQKTVLDVPQGIYTLNTNVGGINKPLANIAKLNAVQKYQIDPCLTPTSETVTESFYWHEVNNEPVVSDVEFDSQNPISFETYIREHYIAPEGWTFEFFEGSEEQNPTIAGTL